MRLQVTRLDESLPMPSYATSGACAFDLYACESATIQPKELVMIPTNLVVKIPEGHVLLLMSRSSTPRKKGLMMANSVGVIDRDYCGPTDELKALVWNFTDQVVTVERGERFAQAMVLPCPQCEIFEAPADGPNRGGFGTTGS